MDTRHELENAAILVEWGSRNFAQSVAERMQWCLDWNGRIGCRSAVPDELQSFYQFTMELFQSGVAAFYGTQPPRFLPRSLGNGAVQHVCPHELCPSSRGHMCFRLEVPSGAAPAVTCGLAPAYYFKQAAMVSAWILICESELLRAYLARTIAELAPDDQDGLWRHILNKMVKLEQMVGKTAPLLDFRMQKILDPSTQRALFELFEAVHQLKKPLEMADHLDGLLDSVTHQQLLIWLELWQRLYEWSGKFLFIHLAIEESLSQPPE